MDDFWAAPGSDTMVMYVGGEGRVYGAPGGDDEASDVLGKVAQQHGAPIFELEHRFYGDSKPSDDLKYLTTQQAMSDIVGFVHAMDRKYCTQDIVPGRMCHKWVLAGGSYAGAFAAWIT